MSQSRWSRPGAGWGRRAEERAARTAHGCGDVPPLRTLHTGTLPSVRSSAAAHPALLPRPSGRTTAQHAGSPGWFETVMEQLTRTRLSSRNCRLWLDLCTFSLLTKGGDSKQGETLLEQWIPRFVDHLDQILMSVGRQLFLWKRSALNVHLWCTSNLKSIFKKTVLEDGYINEIKGHLKSTLNVS